MIAITGATGNIGSKLVAELLAKGQQVRCIARSAEKLGDLAGRGAEIAAISLEDTEALTRAFSGVQALFAMIPPSYGAADFRAYQNRLGASIASAIEKAGVPYVVNLSSQGAHLSDKTGPIKGLYDQELRLNNLPGVHVLHLRPTYFMENLLANLDMIKTRQIMGSAIRADLKLAMIATCDIATEAARQLVQRDFQGRSVQDLLGRRELSMNEAARIIGRRIGKPDLKYVQFSYEDTHKALLDLGMSSDVADLFVEMSKAFNDGLIHGARTPENTTPTSLEDFSRIFVQLLNE
jgi:uncharacterized protein YbjT (DUF2867 family)